MDKIYLKVLTIITSGDAGKHVDNVWGVHSLGDLSCKIFICCFSKYVKKLGCTILLLKYFRLIFWNDLNFFCFSISLKLKKKLLKKILFYQKYMCRYNCIKGKNIFITKD